jgi:MYXO-CTERM domain-containing protein
VTGGASVRSFWLESAFGLVLLGAITRRRRFGGASSRQARHGITC